MLNRKKTLLIFLIVLVLGYVVLHFTDQYNTTFKDSLVEIDTTEVNRLVLSPAGSKFIGLIKKEDGWFVETFGGSFEADRNRIQSILNDLTGLRSTRLVAKSENDWGKFEIDDQNGMRIQVFADNEILADLMVGKFEFIPNKNQNASNPYSRQPQGEMITYMRLTDDKEVYATESMLKLSLSNDPSSYRDKSIAQFDAEAVDQIRYATKHGEPFIMTKTDGKWLMGTHEVDSVKIEDYLRKTSNLKGKNFANGYLKNPADFYASIDFLGAGMETVSLKSYQLDSADFVVEGSQYFMRYFDASDMDLINKVFVGKDSFLKKN